MSRKFIAILTASVASLSINCGEIGASSGPNVDARVSGNPTVKDTPGREKMMTRGAIYLETLTGDHVGEIFGGWGEPREEFLPPHQ